LDKKTSSLNDKTVRTLIIINHLLEPPPPFAVGDPTRRVTPHTRYDIKRYPHVCVREGNMIMLSIFS